MLRWMIYFALSGPLRGWLVAVLGATLGMVLPGLVADPANIYGHDRWADYGGLLGLMALFAYPVGLLPALVSGAVDHWAWRATQQAAWRRGLRRWMTWLPAAVAASATTALQLWLLVREVLPWMLLLAAVVALATARAARARASAADRARQAHGGAEHLAVANVVGQDQH